MKKLLKFAGLFMLLISSFTFAQYNPGGCIPTPPPLDKLIKEPITNDMFGDPNAKIRAQDMSQYLVNFNTEFLKYAKSGSNPPQQVIDIIHNSQQTAYYEIPKSIIEKSTSLDGLRKDLRGALKSETNPEIIQSYILLDYQIQIIQNSPYAASFARGSWKCLFAVAAGATLGATVGSLGGPVGTVAGAAAGGAAGAYFGCK
ncbi:MULTISPECIES: hypothetical protein [unclassified Chryseobacterium]|uniref:hypothetical protein n=1 Tax=unclassified Chryseobacterium TaxID=2593645 RepID=UPI000AD51E00|nr:MULTISPECIES: hypothetical protein [unclassified Chryseobacterium]